MQENFVGARATSRLKSAFARLGSLLAKRKGNADPAPAEPVWDELRRRAPLVPQAEVNAGKRIIAVTAHRRENFGEGMRNIAAALRSIAERPDVGIIIPVHPNPNVRPVMEDILGGCTNVALIEPLDYPHFVRLQAMSDLILTDSGGVQEEAPSLGKPVLVMRDTTERPEGIAGGTAKLVATDPKKILSETLTLLDDSQAYARMAQAHNPYGDGRAADRIARIVADSHA